MTTQPLKFVYEIQNGKFKGHQQTATIQVNGADAQTWQNAIQGVTSGAGAVGSLISLILYFHSVRGSRAVFQDIASRLDHLDQPIPNPAAGGDVEMTEIAEAFEASSVQVVERMAPAVEQAGAEAIEIGALDAAAAASIVPGVGWAIAGIFGLVSAVAAGALTVYNIVNSGQTPLVSIIFINCVPNSKVKFTNPQFNNMTLVGGDTNESMAADAAVTTMTTAGALAYTWQTAGNPNGTATVTCDLDTGAKEIANLTWSVDLSTGKSTCNLAPDAGQDNLLTYACVDKSVSQNGTQYVTLYLILPTGKGAERASFTRTPDKPLVFDNTWATITNGSLFGLYVWNPNTSQYFISRASFVVGDRSYTLRELELPLKFGIGPKNEAIIEVCVDNNGAPGDPIETLVVPNMNNTIMVIPSVKKPRLESGHTYWITVRTSDQQSSGLWYTSVYLPGSKEMPSGSYIFAVGGDPVA